MLLDLEDGRLPSVVPNVSGKIQVPYQMVCKSHKELEDKLFQNLLHNDYHPQYLQTWAIMPSTNNIIQQKNFEMVECLPGEMTIINSVDPCVEDEDAATCDAEDASGILSHRLV